MTWQNLNSNFSFLISKYPHFLRFIVILTDCLMAGQWRCKAHGSLRGHQPPNSKVWLQRVWWRQGGGQSGCRGRLVPGHRAELPGGAGHLPAMRPEEDHPVWRGQDVRWVIDVVICHYHCKKRGDRGGEIAVWLSQNQRLMLGYRHPSCIHHEICLLALKLLLEYWRCVEAWHLNRLPPEQYIRTRD